ncbi:MAG: hypothetical protein RIB46_01255 [Pseudomonadales bacterium]
MPANEKRGRKSAAASAVATAARADDQNPGVSAGRPPVPESLRGDTVAADTWRAIVADMPDGWFKIEHFELLAQFCACVSRAEKLRSTLADAPLRNLDRWERLQKMLDRETGKLMAMARSMRLTHQAQVHPESAHRRAARRASSPAIAWPKVAAAPWAKAPAEGDDDA